MMEEEIKLGEQEREQLRIESQRLREELGDLKIEAELLQDKLKKQESRHLSTISTDLSILESPTFDKNLEHSPGSTASSPLITTPPESKSPLPSDSLSELRDPPSPPMSDVSAPLPKVAATRTPAPGRGRRTRLPSADNSITPKPRGAKPHTTTTRAPGSRISTGGTTIRTPANRPPGPRSASHKVAPTNSLSHIRSLTAQMQRLEARVHSVRSKLPGPTHTPPRASPRNSVYGPPVPSTVTVRSRKRTVGSTTSSIAGDDTTPTNAQASASSKGSHVPRLSTSGVSRLSFGPLPNRGPDSEISRPSSRASISSYARPPSRTDMIPRPASRTSLTGTRTPMGRPRSSLGGSIHGHSASINRIDLAEEDETEFRTPSRRGTFSKLELETIHSSSAIPMPSSRRHSGGRRTSNGPSRASISSHRKLSDLGETY